MAHLIADVPGSLPYTLWADIPMQFRHSVCKPTFVLRVETSHSGNRPLACAMGTVMGAAGMATRNRLIYRQARLLKFGHHSSRHANTLIPRSATPSADASVDRVSLEEQLREAVEAEDFEEAARLRDRLQSLGADSKTLEKRLQSAVQAEDFQQAAKLRDELQLLTMDSEAGALCANNEFYAAFRACDADRMGKLWLDSDRCRCLHPGWPAIEGREEIVSSWEALLSSRGQMDIQCQRPTVQIRGNLACLICLECLDKVTMVVAVNKFEATPQGWKMWYHEAGRVDDPSEVLCWDT